MDGSALMIGAGILLGLLAVLGWVMVLTKVITHEGIGKSIVLGFLCGPYAWLWGWRHRHIYQMTSLMYAWSVVLCVNSVLHIVQLLITEPIT